MISPEDVLIYNILNSYASFISQKVNVFAADSIINDSLYWEKTLQTSNFREAVLWEIKSQEKLEMIHFFYVASTLKNVPEWFCCGFFLLAHFFIEMQR